MGAAILIIEDDEDIVQVLQFALSELGYEVRSAGNGEEGLALAQSGNYSLIILDLMLPKLNGIEVCKAIRTGGSRVPIMMLTAKADDVSKVLGLELGADDYVTKPFSVMEVVARVKALLRRASTEAAAQAEGVEPAGALEFGALKIDLAKRRVWLGERPIELTRHEFDLLAFLASNPGRPFSREQILEHVWDCGYGGYENTISSHINRLRSKIEENPANPHFIRTVRGIGYRFVDLDEQSEQ